MVQRGNDRRPVFTDVDDMAFHRRCLRQASRSHEVAIHAYVLMTNHVHLLLTPADTGGLPAMMQEIGRVYVPYFNRRHERTGALWEGRYRAAVVDDERYFLTCMRYIETNPARADIVRHPRHYRWSSFAANALGAEDDLVTQHPVFRRLAASSADRRAAYADLFRVAIPERELALIRDATRRGSALSRGPVCGRRARNPSHAGADSTQLA